MASPISLTPKQRKEILDSITRIEWSRSDPHEVFVYFSDSDHSWSAIEFIPQSFTRGIIEALISFASETLERHLLLSKAEWDRETPHEVTFWFMDGSMFESNDLPAGTPAWHLARSLEEFIAGLLKLAE